MGIMTLLSDGDSFNPRRLFVGSTVGAIYDYDDYAYLYQKADGSVPYTALEQPVGLMLDKATNGRNMPLTRLPTLPIALEGITGPLAATINPADAITAALAYNSAIVNAGTYYVKPSTGSDAAAGTEVAPFATVARAMRTATGAASRVVMLEDCVIPSFDLRSTDASQSSQQFKWLDANGFNVIIRDSGPDLTAQTWVQDGTQTNCYKATLAVVSSQQPTRVLRTDIADDYGYSRQFAKYASAAALNAGSGDGWYWDNTGKVLWLKIGAGEDVEAQKAILKGLYLNSAGTSRVAVLGSSLGLSGVRLEGVQFYSLDQGGRRPELWLHNCTQLWATNKGADLTNAGWYIATNHLCYASQADGVNAFAKSVTGKGLVLTANSRYIRSGDRSVFALDGTLQGISAHGGSHHVSWGSVFIENNGQGVADTCANNESDVSWLVGCSVTGGAAGVTSDNYFFGSAATSARRDAFIDSCISVSPGGDDLEVSTNAFCQTLNTSFSTITGYVLPYGIHGSQSTDASRATLKGTKNYLLFDGTSDHYTTAFGGGSTTGFMLAGSIQPASAGTARTIFSDRGTNTGYRVEIDASNNLLFTAGNGTAFTTCTGPTLTAGTNYAFCVWHDGTNLNIKVGASGSVATQAFATATAGTSTATLFKDNAAASGYFSGRLYALTFIRNATGINESVATQLIGWAAAKGGFAA